MSIDETIYIGKAIELISLERNFPEIIIGSGVTAFQLVPKDELNSIEYFKLDGIKVNSNGGTLISGQSQRIDLINSIFENCTAMNIDSPNEDMNIYISHNEFNKGKINVNMGSHSGTINLYNNNFSKDGIQYNSITLENIDIYANNNTFTKTGFIIQGSNPVNAEVTNNIFDGNLGRILIRVEGQNMKFNNNKIIKGKSTETYYEGTKNIDFTQNWWGDGNGPEETELYGSGKGYIDFSNWALFQDFSRYRNEPYTIQDIEAAIENLNQAINDINFLYDLDNNNQIEFLDLIWLIRNIE